MQTSIQRLEERLSEVYDKQKNHLRFAMGSLAVVGGDVIAAIVNPSPIEIAIGVPAAICTVLGGVAVARDAVEAGYINQDIESRQNGYGWPTGGQRS